MNRAVESIMNSLPFAVGRPHPLNCIGVAGMAELVRRLIGGGCAAFEPDHDGMARVCHYCRGEFEYTDLGSVKDYRHAADCPFVEAVLLLGDPEAKGSPVGVIDGN